MNKAITLAFKDGEWEIITLPHEASYSVQRRDFRKVCEDLKAEDYEQVELWSSSGGRVKRRKNLQKPAALLVSGENLGEEEGKEGSSETPDEGQTEPEPQEPTPQAPAKKQAKKAAVKKAAKKQAKKQEGEELL